MQIKMENVKTDSSEEDTEMREESESDSTQKALPADQKSKLEAILSCKKDEQDMREILQQLPQTVIPTLPGILLKLLQNKMNYTHTGVSWLKALFQTHERLFMDHKLKDTMKQIRHCIHESMELQGPLNKLKGRLDLLLHQVEGKSQISTSDEPSRITISEKLADTSDENTSDLILHSSRDNEVLVWNSEESEDGNDT